MFDLTQLRTVVNPPSPSPKPPITPQNWGRPTPCGSTRTGYLYAVIRSTDSSCNAGVRYSTRKIPPAPARQAVWMKAKPLSLRPNVWFMMVLTMITAAKPFLASDDT
ncbi:MAG: hypothetical protein IPL78_36130 [Chloroflexi bacterium]|nr:hypothetical protein [Chloroflexota bacterium]